MLSARLWEARMELEKNDRQPCATYGVRLLGSAKGF